MLFYTALFIASAAIAYIAVRLYRSINRAGHVIYETTLPGHKGRRTQDRRSGQAATRASESNVTTPWGWQGKSKTSTRNRARAPVRSTADQKRDLGYKTTRQPLRKANLNKPVSAMALGSPESWACRDEEFEFAGKTYKVKRRVLDGHSGTHRTNKQKKA